LVQDRWNIWKKNNKKKIYNYNLKERIIKRKILIEVKSRQSFVFKRKIVKTRILIKWIINLASEIKKRLIIDEREKSIRFIRRIKNWVTRIKYGRNGLIKRLRKLREGIRKLREGIRKLREGIRKIIR